MFWQCVRSYTHGGHSHTDAVDELWLPIHEDQLKNDKKYKDWAEARPCDDHEHDDHAHGTCKLHSGEEVPDGWMGKDKSSPHNWCNKCECHSEFKENNGLIKCTKKGCAKKCELQDGTLVKDGWEGMGTGSKWCNKCWCIWCNYHEEWYWYWWKWWRHHYICW